MNQVLDHSFDDSRVQTDSEKILGVTPVNAAYPPVHVLRYGADPTGSDDATSAIQRAFDVAERAAQNYGETEVIFPAGIFKISGDLGVAPYVKYRGVYGETGYGSTLPGGGTATSGTRIRWNGGANGKMFDATNVRMFEIDGICFDGAANTSITAIWIDSTNDPSGSQIKVKRFNIRDCLRGVQWGSSGLGGGSYANDGIVFDTFTIWSSVANSLGFTINSGNAGQMSVIKNGGIQCQDLGFDIAACDLLLLDQVFMGGQMNTGGVKLGNAGRVTIKGCSSECWGAGQSSRSDAAYFLRAVTPNDAFPFLESCLTLIGNEVNNDIILDYPIRVVDLGNSWGYRTVVATGLSGPAVGYGNAAAAYNGATPYTANRHVVSSGGTNYACIANTTGNAPPNTTYWSPLLGNSHVLALNNGISPNSISLTTSRPTMGWIDSKYCHVTALDPVREWIEPPFSATDFTGSGAMTWNLTSGDLGKLIYKYSSQTMNVKFSVVTSSVGGTLGGALMIKIPNNMVALEDTFGTCWLREPGFNAIVPCYVTAGSTNIIIQKADLSNFSASTDATYVQGHLEFKVGYA